MLLAFHIVASWTYIYNHSDYLVKDHSPSVSTVSWDTETLLVSAPIEGIEGSSLLLTYEKYTCATGLPALPVIRAAYSRPGPKLITKQAVSMHSSHVRHSFLTFDSLHC